MDISLLVGAALGVCIGATLMSLVAARPPAHRQVTAARARDVTLGVVDHGAPPRRRNKHPRRGATSEEVQPVANVEASLV